MMIPIPQVWQSIDEKGQLHDPNIESQLRGFGAEVVRAARQFADDGVRENAEAGEMFRQ